MLPEMPSAPGASTWKIALLCLVLFLPLIVMALFLGIGVVLPAVWSRFPARRQDAFKVLELTVSAFRSVSDEADSSAAGS